MPPGRGRRGGPADEFMWIHAAYEMLFDPDKRTEPTLVADMGDGPVLDMEAVRMAAIMSKNMEAVRMSERKGIKLGLQAKSMKFCMQKKDQYVKIVAHPDHLIYSETDKLICMVVV
ncbi:hypothetical protein ZIOFF_062611 [Zingiber officinale]|uniref:Uncharacterized protein n=1 Tax=Zingiber officinale TaxID=94328 RepID=A0A8J5F0L9_ZINOF|nr:hypothetical protein ZIOFF_062611 [Zingiber officinale]